MKPLMRSIAFFMGINPGPLSNQLCASQCTWLRMAVHTMKNGSLFCLKFILTDVIDDVQANYQNIYEFAMYISLTLNFNSLQKCQNTIMYAQVLA